MKREVKAKIELRRIDGQWEIFLLDRGRIKLECQKMFEKPGEDVIKMKAVISAETNRKTQGQLGYFYAEVRPKISLALIDIGHFQMNEENTEYYLRKRILGCTTFTNPDGSQDSEPVRLSSLDEQGMRNFITEAVHHGNIDLMAGIRSADEHRAEQEHFQP